MNRHRLEVADVFRECESDVRNEFGDKLSRDQRRAFGAIKACRTNALGGHRQQCDKCGYEQIAYNSCRNRHCPKCQANSRVRWVNERESELLPIPYFHVVFTLPSIIGPLALQNKRVVYAILFRAASETLKQLAADPKHLGAEIGILAVLHTWGSTLTHHPHIHCVVTGGGISHDGEHWIRCKRSKRRKKFFIHVRVLSRMFRGKFIAFMKRAHRAGKLSFHGELSSLSEWNRFESFWNEAVRHDWIVYAKRPFGGPERVLKYLARYTHRVAISSDRLISLKNGNVKFHYKDYRQAKTKVMSLRAVEFIRRFLLHILPFAFVRIRHYGFLANRFRQRKLALARRLLGVREVSEDSDGERCNDETTKTDDGNSGMDCGGAPKCPKCSAGQLIIVEEIAPSKVSRPPPP